MMTGIRRYDGPRPVLIRKVADVVELAEQRVRQLPGSYDPAMLFRELDREHKVEIIRRIMAEMPRGWAAGTRASDRFARYIAHRVEPIVEADSAC